MTNSTGAIGSSTSNTAPSTVQPTSTADLSKNFMQMLLAQLRNQDPLNPMDSAAMTAQLAQLNMVDGIKTTNGLMQSVLGQIRQSNQMQIAGMAGQRVLTEGERLQLTAPGQKVQIEATLAQPADAMKLEIYDSAGNKVFNKNWTALPQGTLAFEWNGADSDGHLMPAGSYTVKAWTGTGSTAQPLTLQASQRVSQTALDDSGQVQLYLANGQQVPISEVKRWLAEA